MSKLRIAVSQFPVTTDLRKNEAYITKHMKMAKQCEASMIHFPECALTGYETAISELNWDEIERSTVRLQNAAKALNIYVAVGLHQKNTAAAYPYNALKLISASGDVLGIYAKRNLYNEEFSRFSAGSGPLIREICGVRCGFLICYDSCFPELFTSYRNENVSVLFLSYYNANSFFAGKNSLDSLMEAQLKTRAADNNMYISGSNSSCHYSRMPTAVASPDGMLVKMKRHRAGILLYDYPASTLGWTYDNRIHGETKKEANVSKSEKA